MQYVRVYVRSSITVHAISRNGFVGSLRYTLDRQRE